MTVWREAAERCRERLKKGSPVYVEGRLRSTSWETKDGQKRSGIEVEAYRLQFLAKTTGEEGPCGSGLGRTETDPRRTPLPEPTQSGSGRHRFFGGRFPDVGIRGRHPLLN